MTKLIMLINEFMEFKKIAHFPYEFSISNGKVIILADAKMLEPLGY